MKKLIKIVLVLVLLLAAGLVVAFIYIDSIAKAAIEKGGTYALGVDTTVKSADVEVLAGKFAMSGLKVANPPGFDEDGFLSLGEGGVEVSLASLRQDVIEMPRLSLSDIVVNLEKKDGKANYDAILANLKRFEGDPEAEAARFVIREIVIENVKVNVDMLPLGGSLSSVSVPINEIVMKNVGESGVAKSGLTMGELVSLIVKTVFAAAIENGGGLIPGDILSGLGDGLKGLQGLGDVGVTIGGETLRGLEGLFQGDLDKVGESLRDAGDELGDKLKDLGGGLLGGDKDT